MACNVQKWKGKKEREARGTLTTILIRPGIVMVSEQSYPAPSSYLRLFGLEIKLSR